MNVEKTIVYKPHIVGATLIICATLFAGAFTYLFLDYKKQENQCNVEINKDNLKIELLQKEKMEIQRERETYKELREKVKKGDE